MNYYNEIDKKAAAWLAELIKQGLIPNGDIDTRSIADVRATDLSGYAQCHFFAGIAGWSRALELAGWPSDRPVWTMSCPCQPFSQAGKGRGISDDRHLWPVANRLIQKRKPSVVFGEQVASAEVVGTQLEAAFAEAVQRGQFAKANKLAKRLVASNSFHYHPRWLDGVRADLEESGYSFRACVLGSHSVNAPHIRQRLHWVAYATGPGAGADERGLRHGAAGGGANGGLADAGHESERRGPSSRQEEGRRSLGQSSRCGDARGLADSHGWNPGTERQQRGGQQRQQQEEGCVGGLGNADSQHAGRDAGAGSQAQGGAFLRAGSDSVGSSSTDGALGFWDSYDLLPCTDGKSRRVEPKSSALADGVSDYLVAMRGHGVPEDQIEAALEIFPLSRRKLDMRPAILRGYGNAINAVLAARFIEACEEARGDLKHG